MSQKKYQVFVSSTFRDLVEERQDAIRTILDLQHIPAGMELFPAADMDQLVYIKKVIDGCDYYVLIVGGRYGSMDAEGVSYTEREYDYAVATGKVVLAFVHGDPGEIAVAKSDTNPEVVNMLEAFRAKVMSGRLVRSWKTRQELEPLVLKALVYATGEMPQVGWVRGDSVASEDILAQANAALQENATLRNELAEIKKSVTPKLEGLAGLDDEFRVRFQSMYRSRTGLEYEDCEITLTWRQIFMALAGFLEKSKTSDVILSALKEAAAEANHDHEPSRMNDTDKITIKAQFEALGLISCRVSKTTLGGFEEFLSLTPNGKAVFLEGRVVRAAPKK